jgi:hypothetical protein
MLGAHVSELRVVLDAFGDRSLACVSPAVYKLEVALNGEVLH